jgi:hypothetical protein
MAEVTTSTSEQFAPNNKITECLAVAFKKAKAEGRPFVVPWLPVVHANHQYRREENDCGCGCCPTD